MCGRLVKKQIWDFDCPDPCPPDPRANSSEISEVTHHIFTHDFIIE